jgi:hypothetical protein
VGFGKLEINVEMYGVLFKCASEKTHLPVSETALTCSSRGDIMSSLSEKKTAAEGMITVLEGMTPIAKRISLELLTASNSSDSAILLNALNRLLSESYNVKTLAFSGIAKVINVCLISLHGQTDVQKLFVNQVLVKPLVKNKPEHFRGPKDDESFAICMSGVILGMLETAVWEQDKSNAYWDDLFPELIAKLILAKIHCVQRWDGWYGSEPDKGKQFTSLLSAKIKGWLKVKDGPDRCGNQKLEIIKQIISIVQAEIEEYQILDISVLGGLLLTQIQYVRWGTLDLQARNTALSHLLGES